jgi:hypothetical protein
MPTYDTDDRRTDAQPTVSNHARLRYRQRVDPEEPHVDEAIRRMFRRGDDVSRFDVFGRARRCGDYLLVFQEGHRPYIKTILYAGSRRSS